LLQVVEDFKSAALARGGRNALNRQVLQPACSRRASPLHVATASNERFAQMRALFLVIDLALELYIYLLVAAAVFSWLIAFNVVNTRNQFVGMVADFLYRITEPALRPIRRRMPNLGGIDISPLILVFIIIFIRYVIRLYIIPNVF
jgi:YggT family protein